VSESAVSAKRGLGLVWRETGAVPKRPSEPRPSGGPPGRGDVEKDGAVFPNVDRDEIAGVCDLL
jgi:hypothetical protein